MINTKPLNILLIAPYCNATDVGEAWSTYQWVSRLAAREQVTVLSYRKRDRTSAVEQLPNVRVIEWDDLPIVHRFPRINNSLKPGYLWFYHKARKWIKDALVQGEHFDLAHQISPLALRYPSPAAGLIEPLVIGPLAGSLNTPTCMLDSMQSTPLYKRLRGIDRWRLKHDPLLRRSFELSSVVLMVAPYVKDILAPVQIKHCEFMNETGVEHLPVLDEKIHESKDSEPIRCLFVGRLARTKGVREAIKAIGLARRKHNVFLDILGDGEDRAACQQLINEHGLQESIRLHGHVPRKIVDDFYRKADIFVFPSFREPSGNVVLEAMSFALPLIVADYGGPGHTVKETFGIKIPVLESNAYSQQISAAIGTLVIDSKRRKQMGKAARQEVADGHLWNQKIAQLTSVYKLITDSVSDDELVTQDEAKLSAC